MKLIRWMLTKLDEWLDGRIHWICDWRSRIEEEEE